MPSRTISGLARPAIVCDSERFSIVRQATPSKMRTLYLCSIGTQMLAGVRAIVASALVRFAVLKAPRLASAIGRVSAAATATATIAVRRRAPEAAISVGPMASTAHCLVASASASSTPTTSAERFSSAATTAATQRAAPRISSGWPFATAWKFAGLSTLNATTPRASQRERPAASTRRARCTPTAPATSTQGKTPARYSASWPWPRTSQANGSRSRIDSGPIAGCWKWRLPWSSARMVGPPSTR